MRSVFCGLRRNPILLSALAIRSETQTPARQMGRTRHALRWLLTLVLSASFSVSNVSAAEPLRFLLLDASGAPYNIFDDKGHVTGGINKDLGELIAKELGTSASFTLLSRRRIEPSLVSGEVDALCFFSPQWVMRPDSFDWSIPLLRSRERLVILHTAPMPVQFPEGLFGMRLALRYGYNYPTLEPLFSHNKATRVDEAKSNLMFRSVAEKMADGLVMPEAEIEAHFKARPEHRAQYAVSSWTVSNTPTQCAISKKSHWSRDSIDAAIKNLLNRGEISNLAKTYGIAER